MIIVSILRELVGFLKVRKKLWLVPILVIFGLFGGLILLTQSSVIAPFIYTGIQLVSHRLLREAPEGKFSTNILWDRAIAEGRLYGLAFSGQWIEVGRPEHIAVCEEALGRG